MATVKSVRMTMTEGSSDKEYRIQLEEKSGKYEVNFQYGRRGGTLKAGTKTDSPTTLKTAEAIYDKLVKEKTGKGYIIDATAKTKSAPIPSATPPKEKTNPVQLLKEVKESELPFFLANPKFIMQEKKDGERRTIDKSKKSVVGGNKKGEAVPVPTELIEALSDHSDITLDGELIGDTYFVFDILRYEGKDLKEQPYTMRLKILYSLNFGDEIVPVKTFFTISEKQEYFDEFKESACEGVVFKEIDGEYKAGREGSTAYKYKFYKTATVKIISISKGKRSVQMGVKAGSEFVEVGSVTIPPNKEVPEVGEFAEVRYLYAYKGGSLFQPTYLFPRKDVDENDSIIDQLEYKQEA